MEKWDLFDENRQALYKTHNRKDKMVIGNYHVVVSIWTVNSKNEILSTLRDPKKDVYPNFWENTAGSVLAGETSVEGALRELREETGILANEEEILFLGTKKEKTAFIDSYIVRKDYEISELKMQEDETVDAKWVTLERFDEMIESGLVALPVAERLEYFRKRICDFIFNK
ncbi:NUDIX hydrolase [Clostridium sp. DL1XJH146]